MNMGFLIMGNLIIWSMIFYAFYNKIYRISLFNNGRKCYFKVHIDDLMKMNEELASNGEGQKGYILFKKKYVTLFYQNYKIDKDGYITLLNEKGQLILNSLILPLRMTLMILPLLGILIDNVLILVYLSAILLIEYNAIIIYLRYRKYDGTLFLDETNPYKHNYITYMIYCNNIVLVEIGLMLIAVFTTHTLSSIIILFLLLIKLHYYYFIDFFDQKYNFNVLDKENMDRRKKREYVLGIAVIIILNLYLGLCPLYLKI